MSQLKCEIPSAVFIRVPPGLLSDHGEPHGAASLPDSASSQLKASQASAALGGDYTLRLLHANAIKCVSAADGGKFIIVENEEVFCLSLPPTLTSTSTLVSWRRWPVLDNGLTALWIDGPCYLVWHTINVVLLESSPQVFSPQVECMTETCHVI